MMEVKTLLPQQIGTYADLTAGDKVIGPGYNKNSDGLATIIYDLTTNWVGTVTIQGTLALYPGDGSNGAPSDWFDITSTTLAGITTTNITGKFIWLRAVWTNTAGQINEIRYTF